MERLARRHYDPDLVVLCLSFGLRRWRELADRDRVAELERFLTKNGFAVCRQEEDEEHGSINLGCLPKGNGHEVRWIDRELIVSPEYRQAVTLEREMKNLGRPPFVVADGRGEEKSLESRAALIGFFKEQGRKGLFIQRYKGLGEMNPDQLWETTMDPITRTLLQVRVEDAQEADQLFSDLMGDQVEPRKIFIQEYAREVQSLDI
ncbi:MAG: hypothetical protein JRC92_04050 [Deltaproteobacteria bacterium]|nr:hypothetical protein [Deltaproteobacteria bacterium]